MSELIDKSRLMQIASVIMLLSSFVILALSGTLSKKAHDDFKQVAFESEGQYFDEQLNIYRDKFRLKVRDVEKLNNRTENLRSEIAVATDLLHFEGSELRRLTQLISDQQAYLDFFSLQYSAQQGTTDALKDRLRKMNTKKTARLAEDFKKIDKMEKKVSLSYGRTRPIPAHPASISPFFGVHQRIAINPLLLTSYLARRGCQDHASAQQEVSDRPAESSPSPHMSPPTRIPVPRSLACLMTDLGRSQVHGILQLL